MKSGTIDAIDGEVRRLAHRSGAEEDRGEEWRPVPGTDCLVSNLGRLRRPNGLTTAGRITTNGCRVVRVIGRSSASMSKLVAAAFLGPKPEGHRIDFLDDDKTNCAASNLQYAPLRRPTPVTTVPSLHKLRAKDDDVPEAAAALAVFHAGLPVRPTRCPRCGAPVSDEPAAVHCVMCGRVFLLLGGAIVAQRRYEVAAGFLRRLGGSAASDRDVRP